MEHIRKVSNGDGRRALSLYRKAIQDGLLPEIPSLELTRIVTSLIHVGERAEAFRCLKDFHATGRLRKELFVSAVKLYSSKRCFTECLQTYDLVADDQRFCTEPVVWSCLLFCSLEVKSYGRCALFFERLKETGKPSRQDFVNMLRWASLQGCDVTVSLWREMREAYTPDPTSANIVLASCVGAERLEEASVVLTEMSHEGLADQITYNTLLKAYAKAGKLDQCFDVYESMREARVAPTQVTYGILLDGCVNAKQPHRAFELFTEIQAEGCEMNTVMYTTVIRGFERAGHVDKAMEVYSQMRCAGDVPLDAVTFSILIKANCDAGRVEAALGLLEALVDMGLKPDGVVFNNLLSGSVKVSKVVLGRHIYAEMIRSGARPSNVTFSTLVTLFVQCQHIDEAVTMLKREPGLQGVQLEPRVCMQLIQSCIRERQGRRVVEVYLLMVDICSPTAESHKTILVACIKLKMFDTASEVLGIIADRSGSVDVADAEALLEVATRKGKKQCVRECLHSIATLGLNVPSTLLERGRLMAAS